ncbi:nuclear transport factor 2 family protein [Streptomyces aureus]|uniref:nuclear transport factor 2 family protein n=1 Tax=Streptomyces aureus TaxID=193461 RepID=UPI0005694ACE|nr:nuclear transport factor 2 family protein [Streptomyces aureus]
MLEHNAAVEAAIESELRLLDPAVRRSADLVAALLHPDFHEFGASGRVWDRASTVASLEAGMEDGGRITTFRMKGVQLAPDLVHLTFDTDNNGRRAHRSSLWRRLGDEWLLYFHQGTLYGPA